MGSPPEPLSDPQIGDEIVLRPSLLELGQPGRRALTLELGAVALGALEGDVGHLRWFTRQINEVLVILVISLTATERRRR